MSNEINFGAVCPMASCKRNAQCVRYANYLKAKKEEDSYRVLNFDRISYDADKGCSHFLVWEKQRWAKGFRKMFRTMPVCNTIIFGLVRLTSVSPLIVVPSEELSSSTPICNQPSLRSSSAMEQILASASMNMYRKMYWWRAEYCRHQPSV